MSRRASDRRSAIDPKDLIWIPSAGGAAASIRCTWYRRPRRPRLYRRPSRSWLILALQASLVGSLAAIGLPMVCLNALAGLGFAFPRHAEGRHCSLHDRAPAALPLQRKRNAVLVQNPDDRAAIRLGVGDAESH